ncbi:MAG: outer membrane lipoprotein-sorting protein [Candidatus Korobacteraceae bacterium]
MGFSPTRAAVLICASCLALPISGWGQSNALTLDQILARMQQSEAQSRAQSVAYAVTREYQLSAAGARQPSSDVVVQVNFVPPSAKDYSIVQAEGSDRGTSIVRKVLDHEARMATQSDQHELSSRNYDFALLGRETIDGHDCYVLQLRPKRQTVELINGKAWVDAHDFALRRIAGVTAKSPSLWLKDLSININYGQVNGVWVQTSTRAIADVRFAGPHVLTSRELDLRPATFNARAQAPPRSRNQRSSGRRAVADTATWVAH